MLATEVVITTKVMNKLKVIQMELCMPVLSLSHVDLVIFNYFPSVSEYKVFTKSKSRLSKLS